MFYHEKTNFVIFRTTILPQPALMKEMLDRFGKFHTRFLEEYKD